MTAIIFTVYARSVTFKECKYFAFNQQSLYFVHRNNTVYVHGNNFYGQLGVNTKNRQIIKMKHNYVNESTKIKLISKSFCSHHCFTLCKNGELFGFGRNNEGQIGFKSSSDNDKIYEPRLIEYNFETSLKEIKAGYDHTLFLSENGDVYGCGSNEYGQLTNGYKTNDSIDTEYTIQKIINTHNVKHIGCCLYSSYALKTNNRLRVFGYNGDGELGIKNKNIYNTLGKSFKSVSATNIKHFSNGAKHVGYFSLKNNKLRMYGSNQFEQCGLSYSHRECHSGNTIIIPKNNETIIDLKCGSYHNIIKTNNNNYYSFGSNNCGELLLYKKNRQKMTRIPTKIDIESFSDSEKIIDLISGDEITYIIAESQR